MLYEPEYCIAATAGGLVLLAIYCLKRNNLSRHSRLFLHLILVCTFASALNILSMYTISYPERFSSFVRLTVNLGYLWLYNMTATLFMMYADSLTRLPALRRPVRLFACAAIVLNGVLCLTSPFTHWIAWFDENLVYQHGFLHPYLYICASVEIIAGLLMLLFSRKKFTVPQLTLVTLFVLFNFGVIVFQGVYPRYVMSNFSQTLGLFFLFSAFESQNSLLYQGTQCYNMQAFRETIRDLSTRSSPCTLTVFRLDSTDEVFVRNSKNNEVPVLIQLSERLRRTFRNRVYALSDWCFVVVTEDNSIYRFHDTRSEVEQCFEQPFRINRDGQNVQKLLFPLIYTIRLRKDFPKSHELADFILRTDSIPGKVLTEEDVTRELEELRQEDIILRNINDGLQYGLFEVYYQPIRDLHTGEYAGAEALVRLRDRSGSLLNTEEMIRVAEANGRIGEIGLFVFEEVCRMIRDRKPQQFGLRYVDVNLSPKQLQNPNLAETFLLILRKYEVPPEMINLEITETSEISPAEGKLLQSFMHEMRGHGITFSLDDFGSGYASMNMLLNVPAQLVKFDKDVLWKAMEDPNSRIVIRHSMSTILEIGKSVLMEGVETQEMEDVVREMGADQVQGYLYTRPIAENEFLSFLREKQAS